MSHRNQRSRRRLARLLTAVVLTAAGVTTSQLGGPPQAGAAQRHAAATQRPGQATRLTCPQGASCGTVTVPLDRDNPDAGTTEVAYALVRRADRDQPAVGTIAVNPGGPGSAAIPLAEAFTGLLGNLTRDHDLLLMDPRGSGASGYLDCEVRPDVFTLHRPRRVQELGRCGESLGDRTRFYTSAAAADDLDAVRAHLGIARLKLYGLSYGTYLMTVYAQRHPVRVDSMVLSGASPLDKDPLMLGNAQATRDAVRLVCERSQDACDPDRTLREFDRLAGRLRRHPIHYPVTVGGEQRTAVLDEAALVYAVYNAAGETKRWGQLPALVHDALRGDHDRLVEVARTDLLSLADLRDAGTLYSLGMALSCCATTGKQSSTRPHRSTSASASTKRAARPCRPGSTGRSAPADSPTAWTSPTGVCTGLTAPTGPRPLAG